jgi:hypothetical protein
MVRSGAVPIVERPAVDSKLSAKPLLAERAGHAAPNKVPNDRVEKDKNYV